MHTTQTTTLETPPQPWQHTDLPLTQRSLAEISEIIHTPSLFHNNVIDGVQTRRELLAVHVTFGNKVAILAGNYLLARSYISLARLRGVEVLDIMSSAIKHLVREGVIQMRGVGGASSSRGGGGN